MALSLLCLLALILPLFVSHLADFSWFELMPSNLLMAELISWLSLTGSAQGIIIPLLFMSIHAATTARQCWRAFYCGFIALSLLLLTCFGLKQLIAKPRPHIEMLQASQLLPEDFYQQSADQKSTLMETALHNQAELNEVIRFNWLQDLSYSMPSTHTAMSVLVAMYFALILLAQQRRTSAILVLIWAASIGWTRALLHLHRPEEILFGAILGILFAAMTHHLLKAKETRDVRIRAEREKKLQEAAAVESNTAD